MTLIGLFNMSIGRLINLIRWSGLEFSLSLLCHRIHFALKTRHFLLSHPVLLWFWRIAKSILFVLRLSNIRFLSLYRSILCMIGHYSILMNAPIVLFLMMISSAILQINMKNYYTWNGHLACVYEYIYASFEKGVFLTDSLVRLLHGGVHVNTT